MLAHHHDVGWATFKTTLGRYSMFARMFASVQNCSNALHLHVVLLMVQCIILYTTEGKTFDAHFRLNMLEYHVH